MKRFSVIAMVLGVLLSAAPPANATALSASEFLSSNSVTIYVRNAGNDLTGDGTSTKPYRSLTKAFAVIPDGWVAQVTIDPGAETTALATTQLTQQPGSVSVSGVSVPGSVTVRGTCSSGQTIALAKTWALVSNRKAQVTSNIGTFTGTVTDGSHFVRSGTAVPYTYRAVRASTTPNLVTVSESTASFLGSLCAWGTTLSGSPTFTAPLGAMGAQHVKFEGVKFSGTPVLTNVKLQGVSIATPGAMTNVDAQNAYFGATFTATGNERGIAKIERGLLKGCTYLSGQFDTVSGVVSATSCSHGQLTMGAAKLTNIDGGVISTASPEGVPTAVRMFRATDIEGTSSTCLYMAGATAILGGGSIGDDMTCYPTTSGGFIAMYAGSRFGLFDATSHVTGTVFTSALVMDSSVLGPLQSKYSVSGPTDGGAFTIGTLVGKETGDLPQTNSVQLSKSFQ